MAKLILFGPNGQEDFVIGDELTIGRRSTNTLRLLEEFVSRDHIKITKSENGYVLEDVSSKEGVGVIVNNVRLKGVVGKSPWHKLRHKDVILINDIQIVFDDPDSDPDFMPTLVPEAIRDKLKAFEKPAPASPNPFTPKSPPKPPPYVPPVERPRQTKSDLIRRQIAPPPIIPIAREAVSVPKPTYIPEPNKPAKPTEKANVPGGQGSSAVAKPGDYDGLPPVRGGGFPKPPQTSRNDIDDMSVSVKNSMNDYIPRRYLANSEPERPRKKTGSWKLPTAMLLLTVLAAAALSGFLVVQFHPLITRKLNQFLHPLNAVAEVRVALSAGNIDAARKIFSDNKEHLSEPERASISADIAMAERGRKRQEIRENIRLSKFDVARALAMSEISVANPEARDEVFMLADFATSALTVRKCFENAHGAEKSLELSQLQGVSNNLQDALEEFSRNKQKLDEYKKSPVDKDGKALVEPLDMLANVELAKIHEVLAPMSKDIVERIAQLQSAEKLWNDVRAAQKMENWDDESTKLDQLGKLPADIVAKVLKGPALENLRGNLNHFLAGLRAVANKQYKLATDEFGQVGRDDPHRAAADKALADVVKKMKLESARALHLNGNSAEAIAALSDAGDDLEARDFREHVGKVLENWNALKSAQAARVSDQIIKSAAALKSVLDVRDGWYKSRAEAASIDARRNASMLKLARLRQLLDDKNVAVFRTEVEAFLSELDRNDFSEMYDEATKLKAQSDVLIIEKTKGGFKEASDLWQIYNEARITRKDLAHTDDESLEKYARQTKLLNTIWGKIRDANQLIESAKPELRAAIKALNDQVVREVTLQSDDLYNQVRKAGVVTEQASYIKSAEERILMMPDVPNNKWYELVKNSTK